VRACLLIPAAWTLFEWLRSWIFTGFPWLSAGYASVGWSPQGHAPLLGVFGLSFIALSLGGMAWLLFRRQRPAVFAAAFVAIVVVGEALRHVHWTEPAGEPVSAALLQGNIEQELKFRPERYAAILATYVRLAESTSAKLIVSGVHSALLTASSRTSCASKAPPENAAISSGSYRTRGERVLQ
jgi:apolipoprotein N-acyltransferase